jgi:hypothetical protein
MFFSEPIAIKNPYNNLPFNKSTLYNIYFFIKYNTNYYPELFFKFFHVDFNLTNFKYVNEYILREKAISNYVFNSTSNIIVNEIKKMIKNYNYKNVKNKIIIDEDFPKDRLIKIFQPYLLLYIKSHYEFLEHKRIYSINILNLRLKRFHNSNPQFGRKRYKIIMGYKKNFNKFIKEKLIEFDDRHIKFNMIENQNDYFLTDHLKYDEMPYNFHLINTIIRNNNHNDSDSEEEEINNTEEVINTEDNNDDEETDENNTDDDNEMELDNDENLSEEEVEEEDSVS